MEESKHRCYGCGGTFIRKELHYRPSGRGAYRRELYFCQICNEKENKKQALRSAGSAFRKTLPARPSYFNHSR